MAEQEEVGGRIPDNLIEAVNKVVRTSRQMLQQIGREFNAAHQYTAVAAYYDRLTFPRLAKFFFDQAEEERGHAMRMVNYLRDTGAYLRLGKPDILRLR